MLDFSTLQATNAKWHDSKDKDDMKCKSVEDAKVKVDELGHVSAS